MGNWLPFMLFRVSCFKAINETCHSKVLRQSADSWYFVIVYPLHVHEIDTNTFKRVIWDLLITVNISFSALQNWSQVIIITIYLLFWMIIWIFDWWTYGASLDKTVKNSNICHLSVTSHRSAYQYCPECYVTVFLNYFHYFKWPKISYKNPPFVFHKGKKVIELWNIMRVYKE